MKKMNTLSVLLRRLTGRGQLTADNSVVTDFDLNRFLGDWYETARFDHRFERGMQHTRASYTLRPDGNVSVLNTGVKDGKEKEAHGIAKITDTPGLLRVSFWRPFYSDYRVMLIDVHYQYALIGSGSDDYLWILSRTPQLSDETKDLILAEARRRGYDPTRLLWIAQ
ncbi:MAG: lipocalin family protein [Muribaculaceae bacterium]|nr:lipocalin family protein [Muribaculaceae bacterium]